MLIPIGSDQATVRRMPWVTFSIIGLCLIAFVYTLIAPGDEEAVVEAEMRAVEYFIDHPHLEMDSQLKGFRFYSLRQSFEDDPVPPASAGRVRAEQETLDDPDLSGDLLGPGVDHAGSLGRGRARVRHGNLDFLQYRRPW
jgi:hypothetical protein